jgi:ABC-type molybdate transport system substrate-binding protein
MIGQGHADIFISYSSNGKQVLSDPDLSVVSLPDALNPTAEYGFALNPAAGKNALLLGEFLLEDAGQVILERYGFLGK